jgi:pimeloyl-ACP methyl ester carboxylesterase
VTVTHLSHFRVQLALHALRGGEGRSLLLLHGLGQRAPDSVPEHVAGWPGPVHALDFTGHGASDVPGGGGYTAELLMGDADTAVAHLGTVTLLGRGLGAYVALLLAGARPDRVRGAILGDGPGLAGGGPKPGSPHVEIVDPQHVAPPDPHALAELSRDVRPPDYATTFVRQATQLSGLDWPVYVCAVMRPDWLAAVVDEPGVRQGTVDEALAHYATVK